MVIGASVRYRLSGTSIEYNTAKIISIDKDNLTITLNRTLSAESALNEQNVEIYVSGMALGDNSHSEGNQTIAAGRSQHTQGEYNIIDPEYDVTKNGKRGKYAHIVGNGSSHTSRSNAHTLDWEGNAWYQGDVYVGSTSGNNKDAGSKKLATEEYVDEKLSATGIPRLVTHAFPITATKDGQTVFTINLESFNSSTDTVMVQDGRTMLFPNVDFTVVGNTVVLTEGWNVGDTGGIYVFKIEMYYPL